MPSVADMRAYLDDAGWTRQPETWRGASVWHDQDSGEEVLVPGRDSSIDNPLRLRQALDVMSRVEQRPRNEIVRDVTDPYADCHTYWTFPNEESLDLGNLNDRYRVLSGIRKVLRTTAESLASDPAPDDESVHEITPSRITSLLDRVEIAPGQDVGRLAIRVPIDSLQGGPGDGLTSALVPRISRSMQLLRDLVARDIDDSATTTVAVAGVSATLCEALGDLSGRERDRPLQVDFRWGRGRPPSWQGHSVAFDAGFGTRLTDLASRLREQTSTTAHITGQVQSLHGQSREGYWEVKVGGHLVDRDGRTRRHRGLRVLLASEDLYDGAMAAHRNDRSVRVGGRLTTRGQRSELTVETGGFEVIE